MNEYVPEIYIKEKKGVLMTTSLDVAEKFGKRRDNVLAAIRKIDAENKDFSALNFKGGSYLDDNNQISMQATA